MLRSSKHLANKRLFRLLLLLVIPVLITGCPSGGGGGSTPPPVTCTGTVSQNRNVTITWTNNEIAVQQAGGGYRVYTSTTQGFSIGSADTTTDVPFSGGSTPKQATVNLPSGMHYIKVVAYSAFGGSQTSSPSTEISVCVPFTM